MVETLGQIGRLAHMSPIVYMVDPLDEAAAAAMNQVGRRIRSLRDESGWSVNELAVRSAVSVDVLRAVETGIGDLELGELSRLAAVLGVPMSALVS